MCVKVSSALFILITGRPIVIEPYISSIDALVAAWLPGSEGQGITDVLFGDHGINGKLPRTWFRTYTGTLNWYEELVQQLLLKPELRGFLMYLLLALQYVEIQDGVGVTKATGFVISDWEGIDRITSSPHSNYTYSVQASVLAGTDMVMVPINYKAFINDLINLVKNNVVPIDRIGDAAGRILLVKFTMGLFENPLSDFSLRHELGSQDHRDLAREAVRKSVVLLKNGKSRNITDPVIPLPKKVSKILVAGSHADNLGYQCGGWTIAWQGFSGNNYTTGTTIFGAIKSAVNSSTEVIYSENPDGNFVKSNNFAYAIVVVGEHPYAETVGDSPNLTMAEPGPSVISNVCESVKCIVIVITGRPIVIEPYVSSIGALVAAWLPGSEGQGITDVLFGDHGFSGKLPRTWFKTVDQLPMNVGRPQLVLLQGHAYLSSWLLWFSAYSLEFQGAFTNGRFLQQLDLLADTVYGRRKGKALS
ncbi:lysosomal beta glucosidase-like [Pyrus ussuriensis x Pyrus communis]|uniref:Lysosomal beta glucosidase-like n=1 Tax=Pyrus ussuriensis x Pyrus communis TaxID=2448454 RepID=A0A5N5HM04_9ROSA|nr:lysosomal beta glucosidase-like [Pyrus ussuriensis x Pyrus communis]